REYIRQVVRRAGIDLSPRAAWLLVQLDEHPELRVMDHARGDAEREQLVRSAFDELVVRGLLEPGVSLEALDIPHVAGCAIHELRFMDHARGDAEREQLVRSAFDELVERGLLEPGASLEAHAIPNDAGCAILDRLIEARREHLQQTIEDWDPARRADVAAAIA